MEEGNENVKNEEEKTDKQVLNESLDIIRRACAEYKGSLQEHNIIQTAIQNIGSFINK